MCFASNWLNVPKTPPVLATPTPPDPKASFASRGSTIKTSPTGDAGYGAAEAASLAAAAGHSAVAGYIVAEGYLADEL